MYNQTIDTIVEKINKEEIFTATSESGGFTIVIEKYVPFICAAIHNGSNMSEYLVDKCILDKKKDGMKKTL